jgi:hypothetical protein
MDVEDRKEFYQLRRFHDGEGGYKDLGMIRPVHLIPVSINRI